MKPLTRLLISLTAAIVAVAITPFLIACHFRGPLADHDGYMRTEYPSTLFADLTRCSWEEFVYYVQGYITG